MIKRIVFITENINKFKELQNYVQLQYNKQNCGCGVSLEMIKPEKEINEIQSLNQEEIVLHKLHDAAAACKNVFTIAPDSDENGWILVEDTSLCITKMGGFPGPFVKFFLQSIPLATIGNENWGSETQSIVNLAIGQVVNIDGHMQIGNTKAFSGCVDGYIVNPRGTNGFGYDSIFRPANIDKTNAEMSMEEKARFNPRILAFQKVLNYLQI